MYSFVNAAIPLSFKGKNAERQVLSDVVSAMDWQTIGDPLCGYRYQYDALGRIAAADYREGGKPSDRYTAEYILDHIGAQQAASYDFLPQPSLFCRFPWHACTLLLYLQCKHLNPSPCAARLS